MKIVCEREKLLKGINSVVKGVPSRTTMPILEGILIQTKIIGLKDSFSKLSATAIINKNCENVKSDIRFAGLIDKTARLKFIPRQKIQSVPDSAEHSAYMFHPSDIQINYLRNAGLATNEIQDITTEAFMNDFNLF